MRKTVCILAALIILLSGCSPAKGKGQIAPVMMTERENLIASAAGDKTLAFNYEVSDKYKWITLSLDEYRLGEKVQGGSRFIFEIEPEGMIILSMAHFIVSENVPQKCTMFVSCVGGWGSEVCSLDDTLDKKLATHSVDAAEAAPMTDLGTMALATIRYAQNHMTYPSQEFYLDPAGHLDEIRDIDITYVMKCRFSEERPN